MASLGTPDCKGFFPKLLQYVRTALYDGFHTQEGLRREAAGSGRPCSSIRKTRTSLFQDGHGTVALQGLASGSSANGMFPPTSGPSSATLAAQDFCASPGPQGPLCTQTPQTSRRTKSHGSSAKGSSRPSPSRSQSRARWPCSSRRGKMGQPRCVSSSTSGAREATAASNCRACCLAAPVRPHQQHPRFDGLRRSTKRRYRLRPVGRR